MISLDDARSVLLSACEPLSVELADLGYSVGCVLEDSISAREPIPPFRSSAMDGYAVRSADVAEAPVRLKVVGSLMAGSVFEHELGVGEALRIMTGAPVPTGSDAVCMVEETETEGDEVVIKVRLAAGTHVRGPGEDVPAGSVLLEAGTVIRPAHVGVLASAGILQVPVVRRARVGVFSSGDELQSDLGPLRPGMIRDSNRPMLVAMVNAAGCVAVDLGKVADREDVISERLSSAVGRIDAVVLSGGVSVGDADLVKVVMKKLSGGNARWMQVAIKPAKPFAFAKIDGGRVPVFGLPGNPVSAAVSFELLVRPALRHMMGHLTLQRPVVTAEATEDMTRSQDGKVHFVRVAVRRGAGGGITATPIKGQGSHQLKAMASANGLAVLPDGDGVLSGQQVEVMLLDVDAALAGRQ